MEAAFETSSLRFSFVWSWKGDRRTCEKTQPPTGSESQVFRFLRPHRWNRNAWHPCLIPRSPPHDGRQVRISRSAILLSNTPVFISRTRRSSTSCEKLENYNFSTMGAFLRIETLLIVILCYVGGLHECTPQCSSSRLCI
jgi:hypothetical protein